MSERIFRIIQGAFLLAMLAFDFHYMVVAFIALTAWEGATNLRIPVLVTRMRFGQEGVESMKPEPNKYEFEAERFQRILIFVCLSVAWFVFPDVAWFVPWFIGAILLVAGVTNVCLTAILGRYLGFR